MTFQFFFRRKTGAFAILSGDSPEKEKGYRLRETDLRLNRTKTLGSNTDFGNIGSTQPSGQQFVQKVEAKVRSPLTYRDLRLQGFTGTRYDAELLIAQGLPHFESAAHTSEVTASPVNVKPLVSKEKVQRSEDRSHNHNQDSDLTVTVRSLRNTPSRLRARCERGRIISDCSSSGISDDTSSSSSGSDRDSGIEMSSSNDHVNLERGVERMNLNPSIVTTALPVIKTNIAAASRYPTTPPISSQHVKLTLRMKRSPVLDEVIACGNAMPDALSPNKKEAGFRQPDYEVIRMEGLEGGVSLADEVYKYEDPEVSFTLPKSLTKEGRHHRRRGKRRNSKNVFDEMSPSSIAAPKKKRLRLVLGNETVSTIDLNSIN